MEKNQRAYAEGTPNIERSMGIPEVCVCMYVCIVCVHVHVAGIYVHTYTRSNVHVCRRDTECRTLYGNSRGMYVCMYMHDCVHIESLCVHT